MTSSLIRPIILCGGNGKRLWPASRKSFPKQFARLTDDLSLLQSTLRRLEDSGCLSPYLMTGEDYRFVVAEQLAEIGAEGHRIVVEPEGRNTAPAVAAALALMEAEGEDHLMLVAPSDHMFRDTLNFGQALAHAAAAARAGHIVTFGIEPTRPETGFGYMFLAEPPRYGEVQPFLHFVEKPDQTRAAEMLAEGCHLWNSGMVLVTPATLRAALERHAPEVLAVARAAVAGRRQDMDFCRLSPAFTEAPDVSIDHAVMERERGMVVPLRAGWNDLGTWRSVWQESAADAQGVARVGEVTAINCTDALLRSDDPGIELVAIGMRNIAAVATRDAVLICDLDAAQDVSAAVAALKRKSASQAETFHRCLRPWGHYETLALGKRFQVKSIVVKPGGKLSLQSHVHRAEHWVVVEGTAVVTIGDSEKLLTENQSVYIPLGEIHRLENRGKLPLRLIEVQTGAYLGEDDIIRYEDIYARA